MRHGVSSEVEAARPVRERLRRSSGLAPRQAVVRAQFGQRSRRRERRREVSPARRIGAAAHAGVAAPVAEEVVRRRCRRSGDASALRRRGAASARGTPSAAPPSRGSCAGAVDVSGTPFSAQRAAQRRCAVAACGSSARQPTAPALARRCPCGNGRPSTLGAEPAGAASGEPAARDRAAARRAARATPGEQAALAGTRHAAGATARRAAREERAGQPRQRRDVGQARGRRDGRPAISESTCAAYL